MAPAGKRLHANGDGGEPPLANGGRRYNANIASAAKARFCENINDYS